MDWDRIPDPETIAATVQALLQRSLPSMVVENREQALATLK